MSELGGLYAPELKVYESGMCSVSQFITDIHSSKFLLIIFTCFQWTVGSYCYPKTEHFLLNCFSLPQIIFQRVLKCTVLNLVKTNLLLLMWFTALFLSCNVSTGLFAKWEQCLCFFVYFYTSSWEQNAELYLVCMPAHLFILRFGAVAVTGGGMFTSLAKRWMGLRPSLGEPLRQCTPQPVVLHLLQKGGCSILGAFPSPWLFMLAN